MPIYLGNNRLTSTGGSGGAIPETAIFTSSGVWTVPQSVRDEIAAEGHAEVGLLMVGRGSTTDSGEIVNELFQLTEDDYDTDIMGNIINPPQISVRVGETGSGDGFSGITLDGANSLQTSSASGFWDARFGQQAAPRVGAAITDFNAGASGGPQLTRLTFSMSTSASQGFGGVRDSTTPTGFTFSNTQATATWTAATPTDVTGLTFGFNVRFFFGGTQSAIFGAADIIWDAANNRFSVVPPVSDTFTSARISFGMTATYEQQVFARQARPGDSPDTVQFRNNPRSTEGYFGGLARFNGQTYGSGGTNPQGGYVQIFYT